MAQRIKKGDEVAVLRGDEKGKNGKVLRVLTGQDMLLIGGLNLRKRHTKPTQKMKQGGIIEKEAPIHRSNVRLVSTGSAKSAAPEAKGK